MLYRHGFPDCESSIAARMPAIPAPHYRHIDFNITGESKEKRLSSAFLPRSRSYSSFRFL